MRRSIKSGRSSSSLCNLHSSVGAGLWQRKPRQKRRRRVDETQTSLISFKSTLMIRLEAGYCPPFFLTKELAGGSPPLNELDREMERIDREMNGLIRLLRRYSGRRHLALRTIPRQRYSPS